MYGQTLRLALLGQYSEESTW